MHFIKEGEAFSMSYKLQLREATCSSNLDLASKKQRQTQFILQSQMWGCIDVQGKNSYALEENEAHGRQIMHLPFTSA